jgi:hypothetical protein
MKPKSFLIHLIMLMILFISCEKSGFRKDISGTWELLGAGGGLSPHEIETNFNYLRLKTINQYLIFNYDTLKASGDYAVYESGYEDNQYFEPFFIRFNKGSNYDIKLTFPIDEDLDVSIINNDTLILSERQFSDGYQYFFTRAK